MGKSGAKAKRQAARLDELRKLQPTIASKDGVLKPGTREYEKMLKVMAEMLSEEEFEGLRDRR